MTTNTDTHTTDSNKDVVRRFYQAVDAGDTGSVEAIFAPEWVNVDPAMPPLRGRDGARQLISMLKGGFPDFSSQIELMAAEGDRVAVRCAHRGTHLGDFLGVSATGKPVAITATGIYIVKDGKLVQNQVIFDAFGLLQQVGVVP
jgi:steroid delta-isomerase-like uncharacterized protein